MDCTLIAKQEFAERYALGKLTPGQCELYERHYFECERCYNELQQLLAIRRELEAQPLSAPAPKQDRRRMSAWWWPALAAAAALVVVVILGPLYDTHAPTHPTGAERAAAIAELARMEPPPYEALVLRGMHDAASTAFREGMKAYLAGDYGAAAAKLREAAAADPARPDVAFYLGASELLSDRPDAAQAVLERLVAMGETPFSEEAHFYLGKALLRRDQLMEAALEFQLVAGMDGPLQAEAKSVLQGLAGIGLEPEVH